MKFTLSWLKDHLETDAPLNEITDKLTSLGLELESLHDRAAGFENFVIGHVVACEQHPDADRLRVCRVDTGDGSITQVVCGAPNARMGMKGVFAPAGTHVPGTGVDLKVAKVRGVESAGMLCSERELGLSDDHDGIIDLPEDAPVGGSYVEYMGMDDPVIEIGLTPDRADCAGVRGIARDLAAGGIGRLKPWPYENDSVPSGFDSPVQWVRDLGADDKACPMVVGRAFRGVKNGPSPDWLQDRLRAIGLRPISALVDITNYVTFDLGRPLHVFDIGRITGDTLTMRLARDGEEIGALDGRDYTLDSAMTVIADSARVLAIGGVMGGEYSGCTEATTDVFVEVALFDPVRTAATGRKLGIESDARYRFERGVDPESALWGAEVAARMILDICGGEASAPTMAGALPAPAPAITLDPARIASLGGVEVEIDAARQILDDLGFETSVAGNRIEAVPPSWRFDVEGEACLVEEVLRVRGFDNIPAVPLRADTPLSQPAITPAQRQVSFARQVLAGRGMYEAVTWSFMRDADTRHFGGVTESLRLANPISADLDVMRPSILPNLIAAAGRNMDRGIPDPALFETGAAWESDQPKGQRLVVGGVRTGMTGPRHWAGPQRTVDAFDAKADALAVLTACNAPVDKLQATADAPAWYHPGRSGALRLGPNVLAWFGEIHPSVLREMGVRGPVVAFEVFLDAVPQPKSRAGKARPLLQSSPYQPVNRDFAFVMADDVPVAKLLTAIRVAERKLVADVGVFDVFTGPSIGPGRKSIAVSVTLQPTKATMTEAEIDAVAGRIVASVEKQTGGVLRS
ncbi:MAG: phenylalanine--tRNA ligase subunit beta [Proteobacteria bacterium]|nr:phenylalanine--tRNA ligase subunit beta [Pseudomonadota bacterium]